MSNLVIPDGGNIGSASDPDAISIASNGKPTFSAGIANTGTIDAGTFQGTVLSPTGLNLLDSRVDSSNVDYTPGVTVLDWSSHTSTYKHFKIYCTIRNTANGSIHPYFRILEGSTGLYYEGEIGGLKPDGAVSTSWISTSGNSEYLRFGVDVGQDSIASITIDVIQHFAGTGSYGHTLIISGGYYRHGISGCMSNGIAISANRSGTTNTPQKFSIDFDAGATSGATGTLSGKVYAQVYGVMS